MSGHSCYTYQSVEVDPTESTTWSWISLIHTKSKFSDSAMILENNKINEF